MHGGQLRFLHCVPPTSKFKCGVLILMYIRLTIQRFIIIRQMSEKKYNGLGLPKQCKTCTTEEARRINAQRIRLAPEQTYQNDLKKMALQERRKQDERDRRAVNLMVYFLHLTNYCAWIFPEPPPPEVTVSSPRSDYCSDGDEVEEERMWIDHVGNVWTYRGPADGIEVDDHNFWVFEGDYTRDEGVECVQGNEPEWFEKKCMEKPTFFTNSTSVQIQSLAEHQAVKKLLPS